MAKSSDKNKLPTAPNDVFQDIGRHKREQENQAANENRYRTLVENSPLCIYEIDLHGHFLSMNRAGLSMLGLKDDVSVTDIPFLCAVSEQDHERVEALLHKAVDGTTCHFQFMTSGDKPRYFKSCFIPIRDTGGKIVKLMGLTEDITERKLAEATEKRLIRTITLLSRCGSLLVRVNDEKELLAEICKLAVKVGGYLMAWVGFVQHDEAKSISPAAQSGYENGYLERVNITWADEPLGQGPVGSAIRTGKTSVIQDFLASPQTLPWHKAAKKRGYNSCIGLPLNVDGQSIGALAIYSKETHAFHGEEVELLEELAGDLAYGIQTLRMRAEKQATQYALRRESEKNLALLHNASDGIHILDFEGNVIEASDSFCDMLGYRRDEIIGMNVSRWDAGFASEAEMRTVFKKQFLQPVRSQFETRHRRKDGTVLDVEVSGFPLELDGRPAVFNSSRDITQRKRAEAELHKIQSSLNAAQYLANIGSWEWNVIEDTAYWSDETCRIFGLAKGKPEGHRASILSRVVPEDRARLAQALDDALNGVNKYDVEYDILLADGTRKTVHSLGEVERDSEGMPVVMRGAVQDITERKQHERQTLESEKRLLEILNASPIAVRIAAKHGRDVVFSNTRYNELVTQIDATGNDPRTFYARPQDYDEILAEVARGKAVKNRQLEFRLPGHPTTWALTSYMPIKYQGEDAVLGWFYDITDFKRTEADVRVAATAFESQEGMLITDANNTILRVNRAFTDITGYAAEEVIGKDPKFLNSGHQDPAFYEIMWQSISDTGAWEGEIWNRRKNGEIYPGRLTITAVRDQDGNVINYVASLSDITQRKKAEEEIQRLAYYDQLTGLPNRRLLLDRLRQALPITGRSHRPGALLFIDLDNFKILNDTLGHAMGDMLLQQVAGRLSSCIREGDTVARLGGDEFVVMLEGLNNRIFEASEQAKAVGEKILAALALPFQLDSNSYICTPSIGITLFQGHEQKVEDLLKQADIAMYQAKDAGRNTLRFFDNMMQSSINTRATLETELRNALEKEQFQLHYQIQKTSLNEVFGVESLIRWEHPERGMVSPAQFIPVAEDAGLILPIGAWVIETACAQLMAWRQDARMRSLILAVNVSARQFHQPGFAVQVKDAIKRHGINPGLLKLELTESLLLEDIEDTISTMNALNETGVQLALDDFGTGYSSLQYLKRLPLDQLKIDQSFVRDITVDSGDLAIVHTIIAMAHTLGLDVIAEGVETEEQRQLLLDSGCSHFQGYLFGKPEPIGRLRESLKTA